MSKDPAEVMGSISDPNAWGEPEPSRKPKSEKRKRGVVVSVRLSAEEFAALEVHAQRLGLPLGTYMRQRALAVEAPAGTLGVRINGSILAGTSNPAWSATALVRVDQLPTVTNVG